MSILSVSLELTWPLAQLRKPPKPVPKSVSLSPLAEVVFPFHNLITCSIAYALASVDSVDYKSRV